MFDISSLHKKLVHGAAAGLLAGALLVGGAQAEEPPLKIIFQAEKGTGHGQIMDRSNASKQRTVWLQTGENRTVSFPFSSQGNYQIQVRYSNDNREDMPGETLVLTVDGTELGQFEAQSTGSGGFGWNNFYLSDPIGTLELLPGDHNITVSVIGGDGYGVEIDAIGLTQTE